MLGHVKKLVLALFPLVGVAQINPPTGTYRAVIEIQGQQLPFGLDVQAGADARTYQVFVLNGKERLPMDASTLEGDSLRIPMSLFDAELMGKVSGNQLIGFYQRKRGNIVVRRVPFRAVKGQPYRFTPTTADVKARVGGKYATTFRDKDGEESTAVGVFEQDLNRVTGTFLTTTGDYRYLDGNLIGDSLFLSAYDGSHLFLLKARVQESGFSGDFFSGLGSRSTVVARRDEKAALPDERTLTFLKPNAERFTFRFPDAQTGKPVSLDDKMFKGKVTVVQIMGSWCPNCMDETNFMVPWYRKNAQRGVEMVGLAYERSPKFAVSAPKVQRMAQRFGITYPVLLAGVSDQSASATLPMLNRIMGYPTTIFVDKKGKVREIHTGFSGPGTGAYYDKFVDDFNRLMDKLLAE
ncbi:MAG: TlpA family protein disulfide reductase [Cytophagaceae bacterium]|nr:TlpA family protein disulfide reductase [Cytophagaceae bacterium]